MMQKGPGFRSPARGRGPHPRDRVPGPRTESHMRWTPGNRENIEDRRGSSGMAMRAGGLGIGGLLLVLILSWVTGVDFLGLIDSGAPPPESVGTTGRVASSPAEEKLVDFVDAVVGDAQSTWRELLGARYQETRAVLFRDSIQSACGFAQSAT